MASVLVNDPNAKSKPKLYDGGIKPWKEGARIVVKHPVRCFGWEKTPTGMRTAFWDRGGCSSRFHTLPSPTASVLVVYLSSTSEGLVALQIPAFTETVGMSKGPAQLMR